MYARSLEKFLRRPVEFLDGTGEGVREWNLGQIRDALAASLREAGYETKARHVEACHRDFRGYRCAADPHHVFAVPDYTCHFRLCPFEMRARAMRARKRMREPIEALQNAKYVVLSKRNCALYDLEEGIASLWKAFQRLSKDFLRPFGVRGAFAVLELTFNAADKTWHPHLNVVLDCPKFVPFAALNTAWIEATEGEGTGSWIGAVDAGTVDELLKYITKLVDFVDIPEAVGAFVEATRRTRFVRAWGSLYRIKSEGDDGEKRARFSCPDCGCKVVHEVGILPRASVFWDAAGQIRFVFDST